MANTYGTQDSSQKPQSTDPTSIGDLIRTRANTDINKYVSQEFQDFGYRLAVELDDLSHKSLYIKMAKTIDRKILEQARTFVLDAHAKSKGRLFMWKVKDIQQKKKGTQS